MAANFERWEKDPFFAAAEEVQESADRMESTYRTWLHSIKDTSINLNLKDLRRELCTALDTTKWQLEEFARAVQTSYKNNGANEAKDRHCQFVLAMEVKISEIQKSLKELAASDSKPISPWVRMNDGECDELALFLSGPTKVQIRGMDEKKIASQASVQPKVDVKGAKLSGHRRSASASADISSWNIKIGEDELPSHLPTVQVEMPLRRAPSLSVFVGAMDSAPLPKLPKNGFRKWKPTDCQQKDDAALLRPQPQSIQACFERNKSGFDNCDDCYDKQLHGWYGALRRLLQRSLYHVQYVRSMQTMFWAALLLFSLGKFPGHLWLFFSFSNL
ncbi:hypothetical protein V2J09_023854 [Rumex salicifolius]